MVGAAATPARPAVQHRVPGDEDDPRQAAAGHSGRGRRRQCGPRGSDRGRRGRSPGRGPGETVPSVSSPLES